MGYTQYPSWFKVVGILELDPANHKAPNLRYEITPTRTLKGTDMEKHISRTFITAVAICLLLQSPSHACTGITLKAQDGAVVFGRTLE